MARAKKHDSERSVEEEADADLGGSSLQRLSQRARTHPVTTLALAAGVGALMGAELLAAGLAGGAAILLLQRSDLRARARRVVESARDRISDGVRQMERHA
jgi:ElaB/YqjD/DUF883 family membrane-anchored ribosome-binding protein